MDAFVYSLTNQTNGNKYVGYHKGKGGGGNMTRHHFDNCREVSNAH
jgi:hypothetical protein